jgi:uncharacterized protein (AIM24 family)
MRAACESSRVRLDPTLFLRIVGNPGTTVACLSGCLWITRDGCPKDFELAAGQEYRVDAAAPVIVGAFEPSLASVQRAQRAGPWRQRLSELVMRSGGRGRYPNRTDNPAIFGAR